MKIKLLLLLSTSFLVTSFLLLSFQVVPVNLSWVSPHLSRTFAQAPHIGCSCSICLGFLSPLASHRRRSRERISLK